MLKKLKLVALIPLVALLVIGFYYYWRHSTLFPSTDDAYIQANMVSIAPQVNGKIIKTYVQNQQPVKAGDPLFDIDPTPYQLSVNQAQAAYDNAIQSVKAATTGVATAQSLVIEREAELAQAQHDYDRVMSLVNQKLYPATEGDKVTAQLSVDKAVLSAAKSQLVQAQQQLGDPGDQNASIRQAAAALSEAKLNLKHTNVLAPADGHIENNTLRVGAEVTAFEPLFTLVEDNQWWATANFKETDLARIQPGQTATVKLDMYPRQVFIGQVSSISAGSGASFALLPPENATGNWVKVTQRFPVKISLKNQDPQHPLRVGASCTVTINTHTGS